MSNERDNSGTLSRNERKTSPNQPDHKGSIMIEGKDYWLSAWVKEGPNGRFFSLAVTPKDQQQGNR